MESTNNISAAFKSLLGNLVDGKTYNDLPPKAVENVPTVSNKEVLALDENPWGEDDSDNIAYSSENGVKLLESFPRKEVTSPSTEQLDGVNILGIHGDNQRILTPSFHLIFAKTALVNFKYTKGYEKPYFYNKTLEVSSIMLMDDNIFIDGYRLYTNTDLQFKKQQATPILDKIIDDRSKPFLFTYDHEISKKAPNSQSLGLAVKFQHALELASIREVDIEQPGPTICIKKGSIFSNSSSKTDIQNGLKQLISWKNKPHKIYLGFDDKIQESRLFIKALNAHNDLLEACFPNQGITNQMISSFGNDGLLLKKALLPGTRTPMISYMADNRKSAIDSPELSGLAPVTCFYHKKSKPFNIIRIEMPRFMWEQDKEFAEFAISILVWQHELGIHQPLVITAAKDQCSLAHEKMVIEQQLHAEFYKKELELIEFLNVS